MHIINNIRATLINNDLSIKSTNERK